jgi:peptide/histidine transporter 3/4
MVTAAATPGNDSYPMVFGGLYLLSLGCGGIKPNVSTFGAEQFDDSIPLDRIEKESFFNWWQHIFSQ